MKNAIRIAIVMATAGLISGRALANPTIDVTVGGQTYDITYVIGTFNNLETQLEAQPWWTGSYFYTGDLYQWGEAVGGSLGYPSYSGGPVFAYVVGNPFTQVVGTDGSGVRVEGELAVPLGADTPAPSFVLGFGLDDLSQTDAYAVLASTSTNVPEPASLTLLGLGLIGMRLARRRVR